MIHYHPGKQSEKPDALSRRSDHGDSTIKPQSMLREDQFSGFTGELENKQNPLLEEIIEAYPNDPSLDLVLAFINNRDNTPPSISKKFSDYTTQGKIILYQGRILVPDVPSIKQQLLKLHHDTPEAGHQGQA